MFSLLKNLSYGISNIWGGELFKVESFMRYFVPAMCFVALSLAACSPKSAPETAADVAISTQPQDAQAEEEKNATGNKEEKIATGIVINVCELPKISEDFETNLPMFNKLFRDCMSGTIGFANMDLKLKESSLNIELHDSFLHINHGHSNQYNSMVEFANTLVDMYDVTSPEIEKDQAMSERMGFESFKLTYPSNSESEDGVEGYCTAYGYADYCIIATTHGHDLDEFRDAVFSHISLVTKTEAQIEEEEENKRKKEIDEANEKYGGVPRIKMANPEVIGNFNKRNINKVVRTHSNELKACYEKALIENKGQQGKIIVSWEINASGEVAKAAIKESTLGNADAEICFTDNIKTWRFPSPKDGGSVQVDYPFQLEVLK